jgi:large subunit ribosomal protein L32
MAVPKRKTSPSRRGKRRSHDTLFSTNLFECPNCGEFKLAHHICNSCGHYNKKEIINKTESETEDKDLDSEN